MSFEAHLAQWQPLLQRYGYGAVFVATFLEGFGIPAPGQTLLMGAALLAARGELSLALVLATAAAASAAGGLVGWAIGRWGGQAFLARFASGARLSRIEELFSRWGPGVVLLGRFVDGARQLNGLVAGALRMPLWRFLLWSTTGALVWTGFWGLGVYWLGRDFHSIAAFFHHVRPLAAIAIGAVVALAVVWLVRGGRPRPSDTPPQSA
jgi:membrane protein DedA with SNARE-associated domain